jgi:hypothetical protein
MKTSFNKYLYLGFVLFGFYQLLYKNSISDSVMYFGLALAFDPFNQDLKWDLRPKWQKLVLIIHLILVFYIFGMLLLGYNLN